MRKLLWVLSFTLSWISLGHAVGHSAEGGSLSDPAVIAVPLEEWNLPNGGVYGMPGMPMGYGANGAAECPACGFMGFNRSPNEQRVYTRVDAAIQNADYELFRLAVNNKDGIRVDPNQYAQGMSSKTVVDNMVARLLDSKILEESYRNNPGTLDPDVAKSAAEEQAKRQADLQKMLNDLMKRNEAGNLKISEGTLQRLDDFLEEDPNLPLLADLRKRTGSGDDQPTDAVEQETADVASAVAISTKLGSANAIDAEMRAKRLQDGVVTTCNTEYLRYLMGRELSRMTEAQRHSPRGVGRLVQNGQARDGSTFCSFLARYSTRGDPQGHVYFTGSIELSDEATGQKELLPDSVAESLIQNAGGAPPASSKKAQ